MNIYVKPYIVENEKKRLFIIHGICEHSGRYQSFAEWLNQKGVSVITYDLRGHGKSEGRRVYIKHFVDHLIDLTKVIDQYQNSKVEQILLGHSMGGLIGYLYMNLNPKVDRIIASGAPTDYLEDVKILKYTGFRWFGWVKRKNNFADDSLSHDKAIEEQYKKDPLVSKYFTVRLAGEMFYRGVKHLNNNLEKLQKPVLILHGEKDKIVPKEHSERIFDLIDNKNKKLILYPDMYHEILNELDKEKVYNDILGWLNEI